MGEGSDRGDRYVPVRLLGEGGAGRVWLVEDRLRGQRVALKELAEGSRGQEATLEREFATLASLRHPSLVEVHDLDLSPATGLPRFSLEYVEGEDIVAAVRREGPLLLLDLAAEALRALGFLHDFGLVHRDLKPGNLLVRARPRLGCRLVLLDFGLASQRREDAAPAGPAGTLPYLAPELFDGEPATRRSDLYALGAVLFHAMHGRPPFAPKPGDLAAFVEAVRTGTRARPSVPGGYPAGIGAWVEEMLSPGAALRPAEAAEALARLNAACGTSFAEETPASRAARLASGSPPGRESEIAALWEHLAPSEEPRLVWLAGGPGTGKSRILRWLESDGVTRGWDVAAIPPGLDAQEGRTSAEIVRELRARAVRGPTLVLADEAESATGRVAEILDRVAREGREAPLRVLAAVRPLEVRSPAIGKLLADAGRVPTLRRVDLDGLDASGIRAMAERATGQGTVTDARVRWLLEASEGSPLAVEALLVEGSWEKGGRPRGAVRLDAASMGRVELLSSPARSWLDSLAVLGNETPAEWIARLAGLGPEEARDAADEAAAAGLARQREGSWSLDSRALSDAIRAAIEPAKGVSMHRRGADLVGESAGDEGEAWRLARLWSGAREPGRAAEAAARAAGAAAGMGEPLQAADRLAFAIAHAGRRDPGRREYRMRQGDALLEAARNVAAARAFAAAYALSRDAAARAEARSRQAYALALAMRVDHAEKVAKEALELARALGSKREEALALRSIGIVMNRSGRMTESVPLFEQAVEAARASADPRAEAEALQNLGAAQANARVPGAEESHSRAIEIFTRLGCEHEGLKSILGLAQVKGRERSLQSELDLLERARRIAADRGHLGVLTIILLRIAAQHSDRGRLDRALAAIHESREAAVHLNDSGLILAAHTHLGELLIYAGRPSEAVAVLRNLPQSRTAGDRQHLVASQGHLAQALLESVPPDEAGSGKILQAIEQECRALGAIRPLIPVLTVELERRALPGCTDPPDAIMKELDLAFDRLPGEDLTEFRSRAGMAQCAWRLAHGEAGEALRLADDAARLAAQADFPAFEARAHALRSAALSALGRSEEAASAMERGRRLLDEAASRIEDPDVRRDFLDRVVYRPLRQKEDRWAAASADRRLLALYDMIRGLNSETDPEALLESILDMALRVVQAERGMILLRSEGGEGFSVRLARNLEKETADDAERFSHGIVAKASEGKAILALDAGHDDRFQQFRSISLYRIRSLMCVPLRSRGAIVGTVYLDSRREGRLFTQDDLRFLEAFADHAALALENARARAELERENRRLQAMAEERTSFGNIVGRSPAMQRVFDLIEKVAASELPVLIQGESGTGKELVARAIHFQGPRRKRVFLSENCAAIPESLLESELFGHVRGAFTGAERDRAGLFEQADRGTLFLDEVGDMSPGMQARLLRALQEGEIRRVGASKPIHVDVRVLAATNKDLQAETAAGRFREDLLYRLQVLLIQIAPLRERPGDVALLTDRLLERIGRERGRKPPRLHREVLDLLERYPWPGNVRQLENALQRLTLLAGDGPITRAVVEADAELRRALLGEQTVPAVFSLEKTEKEQIARALRSVDGNRDRAAKLLGISRATIYRKIKEYRIR